ncbi:MAG: M23 family metallopeptidase [Bacteroidia bacterium]
MRIVLFFVFIISFFTSTQKAFAYKNSKTGNTITDTIPFSIDEDELSDYSDSLAFLPAYDLYCNWDTVHTHSAKFDIAELKDEVKEIVLYNENSCGYVHPITGKVTSGFGPRKKRFHYGADIDLETGDAVSAAFDGKVRIAKISKSYGQLVVIRHNNGLETYYAHLSKINVEVGDEVYAGQTIGLGGNTGKSRGSHLHFEVRYLGHPIDPTEIISFTEQKLVTDTLCVSKKTFNYIEEAKKAALKNQTSKAKVHVVKKGDTLYGIARKYKTSQSALCKKNGLKTSSKLKVGQRIKI